MKKISPVDKSNKSTLIEDFNRGINRTFEQGKIEGKLELLKDLYSYIFELGRTQFNNRMALTWIDSEKIKINKKIKDGGVSWNEEN